MHATALTGTHNDLDGIPDVGIVRAKKALRDPAVMRKYRAEWAHIIDRNLSLIRLPHRDLPKDLVLPKHQPGFDVRRLYKYLGRYDIDCTNAMEAAFTQFLRR
jgi:hypothetical protein